MGMGGFGLFFLDFFSFGFPLDIIFRFSSSGGNVVLEYYETWGARAVSFSRFDSWFKVIGSLEYIRMNSKRYTRVVFARISEYVGWIGPSISRRRCLCQSN